MKIVILDTCNARVEVLSVSDELIARYDDDVEDFLIAHDYPIGSIDWFAVPAKEIPCKYHIYNLSSDIDGSEMHAETEGTLEQSIVNEGTY